MKKIAIAMLAGIAVILIMILCSSCNTYQKQLNKWTLFSDAHPNLVAERCAKDYPVKETVGATTIDSTHRANNVNYSKNIDSLQTAADALVQRMKKDSINGTQAAQGAVEYYKQQMTGLLNQISQLKQIYKGCKPDTVYKTKIVYRLDQAALTVANNNNQKLRDSLNLVKSQLKDEQDTSAKKTKWLLALGGILLALGAFTVFKILGKL